MDTFKQVSIILAQVEERYLKALELTQQLNQSIQENSLDKLDTILVARAETIQAVDKLRNELGNIQRKFLLERNQIKAEFNLTSLENILHPGEFRLISDQLVKINHILAKILEIDHDCQVRGQASLEKIKIVLRRVHMARNTHMAYSQNLVMTEPRFIDKKK